MCRSVPWNTLSSPSVSPNPKSLTAARADSIDSGSLATLRMVAGSDTMVVTSPAKSMLKVGPTASRARIRNPVGFALYASAWPSSGRRRPGAHGGRPADDSFRLACRSSAAPAITQARTETKSCTV